MKSSSEKKVNFNSIFEVERQENRFISEFRQKYNEILEKIASSGIKTEYSVSYTSFKDFSESDKRPQNGSYVCGICVKFYDEEYKEFEDAYENGKGAVSVFTFTVDRKLRGYRMIYDESELSEALGLILKISGDIASLGKDGAFGIFTENEEKLEIEANDKIEKWSDSLSKTKRFIAMTILILALFAVIVFVIKA